MRIKNLTNSPYEITNAKGEQVMIPARGEIEIDPHHTQEPFIRAAGYFEIEDNAEPAKEVDQEDDPVVGREAAGGQPKRRGRPPKAQV